ncbi:ribbon-helix-helix domain-containing protein [Sporichthya polymorpha]|uniref:ribbon-helix-helix domain-containing protein n=1 Tax=Sporichthya polymorpha TaxID=35751 RepID=UPI0003723AAA|nr:ribbon-helix-helix domain-containing protein [Sporichthya polymorpha]
MKISVSLPDEDVELLDNYARTSGLGSRSAALAHAVHLLRHESLGDEYEAAWAEWEDGSDAEVWQAAVGDGLPDASR